MFELRSKWPLMGDAMTRKYSTHLNATLRSTLATILVGSLLCACQGDDNSLPLPPSDAGADAHADASVHDGSPEAATDSGSESDATVDGIAGGDAGDAGDAETSQADSSIDGPSPR